MSATTKLSNSTDAAGRSFGASAGSAILNAEERSANWLAKGNELAEKGKLDAAERAYDKSTFWLVQANKLRRW